MFLAECLLAQLPYPYQGHVHFDLSGAFHMVDFGASVVVAFDNSPIDLLAYLARGLPLSILDF